MYIYIICILLILYNYEQSYLFISSQLTKITYYNKLIYMSQQVQPHILKKYQLVRKIGSGAYGHVWKVIDKKTKEVLALKKIFDAFQHSTDAQRTYREITFLKQFDHENIIKLYNVIRAENDKDIYLVFQFMEIDLHSVIRENILKDKHKQYIIYQIAKALKYLHSTQLLHRDLKPSNVLINSECLVKICDFGLVRSIDKSSNEQEEPVLTQYIATRWYRAPEILLGSHSYTKGIDIWSFGCIMGQMLKGKPMFPGSSTLNQLQKLLNWTGSPSLNDIQALQSDIGSSMIQNMRGIKQKNIRQWFPAVDDIALDLLSKMLQFNPKKRITINQILEHPYLKDFHNTENEPICDRLIKSSINDNKKLSLKQYRLLIYKQIGKKQQQKSKDLEKSEIKCQLGLFQKVKKKQSIRSITKQDQQFNDKQNVAKTVYIPNKRPIYYPSPLKNSNADKSMSLNKKYQKLKSKYITEGKQEQIMKTNKGNRSKLQSAQTSKKHSLKYNAPQSIQKPVYKEDQPKKKAFSIYSTSKKTQLLVKYLNKAGRII